MPHRFLLLLLAPITRPPLLFVRSVIETNFCCCFALLLFIPHWTMIFAADGRKKSEKCLRTDDALTILLHKSGLVKSLSAFSAFLSLQRRHTAAQQLHADDDIETAKRRT